MPLVTRSELTTTLNIGTLYSNDVLDQIIGSAEQTILALLVRDRHFIDQACCSESVPAPGTGTRVRFRTTRPHGFRVDDLIRIGEFPFVNWADRLLTVVEVPADNIVVAESTTPWTPGVSDPTPVLPLGLVYRQASLDAYDRVPAVKEAALAIAVDIFQSRVAPGGQMQGVDFTPGPYRLGASLKSRIAGLIGRWMDTGTLVG
jgi:hypothetical protein